MSDLADLSATQLLAVYESGEASPTEAVQSCIARIEATEPHIHAVMTLLGDRCLSAARIADRRWHRGNARRLEGLPFGLKDIIATAGIRTSGGSRLYSDYVPNRSATVHDRLQDAGAMLLAKLQTFELAMGDDSHHGPTRNPWDHARTSGGSSSGNAAALAARQLPVAVGSDSGGSIRVPASCCGVTGFKPTLGRVPRTGVMTQSWTLDHIGPMARSVDDVLLIYRAIAGPDGRDNTALKHGVEVAEGDPGVRGLRLGVPVDCFSDVHPDVRNAVEEAKVAFEQLGVVLVDIELPHAHLADVIGWIIMYAEYAAVHSDTFHRMDEYGRILGQQLLANSPFVYAIDYIQALRAINLLQTDYERAFERVDAVLTPTLPGIAPLLDDWLFDLVGQTATWGELVGRFTLAYNLTGMPALSLPAGLSREGMPLGIQIATRPLEEDVCLWLGRAFQQATVFHELRPPLIATL